jgi:hypothetical protein
MLSSNYYKTLCQTYYGHNVGPVENFTALYNLVFELGLKKFTKLKVEDQESFIADLWNQITENYPQLTKYGEAIFMPCTDDFIELKDIIEIAFPHEKEIAEKTRTDLRVLRAYMGLFNHVLAQSFEEVDNYEFTLKNFEEIIETMKHPYYNEVFDAVNNLASMDELKEKLFSAELEQELQATKERNRLYKVLNIEHSKKIEYLTKERLLENFSGDDCGSSQCFCRSAIVLFDDESFVNAYDYVETLKKLDKE